MRRLGRARASRETQRRATGPGVLLGLAPPSAFGAAPSGTALDPTYDLCPVRFPVLYLILFLLLSPSAHSRNTSFVFHPARGWGAPTGARVPARHPDLRAMTGARRLVRDACVPTQKETLASRRSTVAILRLVPVLPVVRDSLRGRAATLFAARVTLPGGPGLLSLRAVRPINKPGRGRHLPRSALVRLRKAPLDERG